MTDLTPEPVPAEQQASDTSDGRSTLDQGVGRPAMHTRASASWVALVLAVVFLILLVIFIAQNTQRSTVNFLGLHGHAPVAVVLLIAALAGAVIVIVAGATRILQLRRAVNHPQGREPRRGVGHRAPTHRPTEVGDATG